MTDDKATVIYEVDGAVARITLNRPEKRNALNDELIAALKEALSRAGKDESVRVIALAGAGSDFCGGADLSALQKISQASVTENLEDARSLMELYMLIREVRVPVICAVRGRALAGGCGLALACDLVVAGRSARFGFPEVKIGFVPAMVMAILRRSVSEKKAFAMIALGDEISAEEAERCGMINYVLGDDDFQREFDYLLHRVDKLSRSAVGLAKRLFYRMDSMDFEAALSAGVDVNVIARMSKDCQEGIARFTKK